MKTYRVEIETVVRGVAYVGAKSKREATKLFEGGRFDTWYETETVSTDLVGDVEEVDE